MKTNTFFTLAFLLLFWHHSFSQLTGSSLSPQTSSESDTADVSSTARQLGTEIQRAEFNDGHFTDALQLVQGRLPALLITRAGNDPNGIFDARLRGLKSFDITEPLYVIDGIPVSNLDGLHPNDIQSVKVLRGGAEAAIWGIRGANGVVEIQTRRGESGKTQIQYQVYRASESITKTPDLMDAINFKRLGGNDVGSDTDWWREITQKANSQTHHLSLSGGTNNSSYYGSLNYDDVNGIAIRSGFQRINGRLSFEQRALDDRLKIKGGLAMTNRSSRRIPLYAFWHATSFNPSAPVFGEGAEFERFGGYYEDPNLYRNYNPVAMIELNEFSARYQHLMAYGTASLKLTQFATASVSYGNQTESLEESSFSPSTSFYIGANRNGWASQSSLKRNNQFVSADLNTGSQVGKWDWNLSLGYQYQSLDKDMFYAEGGDFLTDVFRYNNLSAANDFANGRGEVISRRLAHHLSRYRGQLHLAYDHAYFLSATISREGSSILGANRKWGWFYGAQVGASLGKHLAVRASYGLTGNLPSHGMLSQQIFRPVSTMFFNGAFVPSYGATQYGNPNLQWEQNAEMSIGTDFVFWDNRLHGSLEWYATRSSYLIQDQDRVFDNGPATRGFENIGMLSSSGIEYALQFDMTPNRKLDWQLGVVGAKYFQTRLHQFGFLEWEQEEQERYIGILGGACAFPVFRIKEGETVGEIWGYELVPGQPVTGDGEWNRIDHNGDGFASRDDYVQVGNALPKSSIGISNRLDWGRLEVDVFFRGIFGHDVVNHIKSFHSVRSIVTAYNVLHEAREELSTLTDFADFSDRDVENGSYLRLAHLTFSYDLPIENKLKGVEKLGVYTTFQNLFTLTGYSGLDPEFRMEDRNSFNPNRQYWRSDPFVDTGDPLVPGMDRRNSYPASRAFIMGLSLSL